MDISFSRRTDLALRALRVLAEEEELRIARTDLAHRLGTTPSYLSHVMAPLVRCRWVISDRGPGGGYRIAESAYQVRLLTVIEATEDPEADRCVLRNEPCSGTEACPVHAVWAEAKNALLDGLDMIPAVGTSNRGRM
jgi:Rrf2 family iron-sulfur cluster assembly transcriptional regulator